MNGALHAGLGRALGDPDDENFVQDALLRYFMAWYREHKLDHTYAKEGTSGISGGDPEEPRDGQPLKNGRPEQ